jgi:hypothetical protein
VGLGAGRGGGDALAGLGAGEAGVVDGGDRGRPGPGGWGLPPRASDSSNDEDTEGAAVVTVAVVPGDIRNTREKEGLMARVTLRIMWW